MKSTKTAAADALRQLAYEMAASPESTPDERRAVALLLHQCGEARLNDGRAAVDGKKRALETAKACFEKRAELPEEYENPLDDDEKLRAVRIAVFGSAPE